MLKAFPFNITPPRARGDNTIFVLVPHNHLNLFPGLLLAAAKWSDTLEMSITGDTLPSTPLIRMTMDDISRAGVQVLALRSCMDCAIT